MAVIPIWSIYQGENQSTSIRLGILANKCSWQFQNPRQEIFFPNNWLWFWQLNMIWTVFGWLSFILYVKKISIIQINCIICKSIVFPFPPIFLDENAIVKNNHLEGRNKKLSKFILLRVLGVVGGRGGIGGKNIFLSGDFN